MTSLHRSSRAAVAVIATALAVTFASCVDSDEPIIVEPTGGTLFDRYVAMGNSLTAGVQSGGIVDSVQQEAYPVLLAAKANAPFGVPSLARPGCPPLLVGPLTTVRTDTVACGLRTYNAPDLIQNVAVPSAKTGHLSETLGTGSILNTMLTGGRSQIQAMQDADPTLVSVWIGNNDVLGAALIGDTLAMTPLATFQSEYGEIVEGILETGAEAVLLGVVNPMSAAPALQPGAYFYAIGQNPPPGINLDVSDNCAPFDSAGNPNVLARNLVSFTGVGTALAAGENPVTIDCQNGVEIGGTYSPDYLLDLNEQSAIVLRLNAMNSYISSQASGNTWLFLNPNNTVIPLGLVNPDRFRKCQDIQGATDSASFAAAVQSSCPVDLDPTTPETFFGSWISFDGLHPTLPFHGALADAMAALLNEKYEISLPIP